MSIQVMARSKQRRLGFATGSTMLIHMVDIAIMDRLVRIDGEKIGHPPGSRKNGEDRISLECVEVADPSAQVDLSVLEVRVVDFSDAVT
jgi:hypothetical protein